QPDQVLRYRAGRWAIDEQWTRELKDIGLARGSTRIELAFGGPDDAWIINSTGLFLYVYHLADGHWIACLPDATHVDSRCDDPNNPSLPIGPQSTEDYTYGQSGSHLTTAGDRVYIYGTRGAQGSGVEGGGGTLFPYILYKDPGHNWAQVFDPS